MPTYCYSNADRTQYKEIVLGMRDEKPEVVVLDGVEFRRDIAMEHTGPPLSCGLWPLAPAWSVGVAEHQVPEMRNYCREYGVGETEFVEGNPVFRDRAHMKRYCRTFGYVHEDYG